MLGGKDHRIEVPSERTHGHELRVAGRCRRVHRAARNGDHRAGGTGPPGAPTSGSIRDGCERLNRERAAVGGVFDVVEHDHRAGARHVPAAGPLYINGTFTNVGIRGATDNADDVVLKGRG